MDSKGNFYGVTEYCGTGGGIYSCVQGGTLWKMTSTGVETVLHSFAGAISSSDGYLPVSAPVWDAAGNLWGTTDTGGTQNGTIYEWSAQGVYSVPFILPDSGEEGSGLASTLLLGSNGSFYGPTIQGGSGQVGLVFEFTPPSRRPQPPSPRTLPILRRRAIGDGELYRLAPRQRK